MSRICSVGALVGLAIGLACSTELHGHCSHENNNGDFTCAERGGGRFCDGCTLNGDGCTDVRPTDACHVAGVAAGSTTGGEGTTTTTPNATTTPAPELETSAGEASGEEPCTENDDCGGATPICEMMTGQCVPCNEVSDPDGACMGLDPGLTSCIDGVCAQCDQDSACGGDTPVCDAAHTCVGCTEHAQCGNAACNFYTGECLSDRIVHVGPDAGMDYDDLESAVASFTEMTSLEGTIIVHDDDYDDTIVVDGGRVLAFIASGDDFPRWDNDAGDTSQLTVDDGTAILDGLMLSGASSAVPSVRVSGDTSHAWIDRSKIVDNNGDGIIVEGKAELTLRNCFVTSANNNKIALTVDGSTAHVVYSTLLSDDNGARALVCASPVMVEARNSLFITPDNEDDEVQCMGALIEHSAAETDLGGSNVGLGSMLPPMDPMDPFWFESYLDGDLHLTEHAPEAIASAARWQAGDPPTDIDGDPRPPIDREPDEYGVPDYAGADVP